MTQGNREWFREAIEAELARIGAHAWRYVGYRSSFKGKDFESERDAEMEAEGIGAVLRDAGPLLATLRTVPSGAGDDALTEAFFGVDPA